MAPARSKVMTAEEFYDWGCRPENQDRHCDLVRGVIVEFPPTGKLHGFVCANVAAILGNHACARRRGYVCSNNTGVIVARNPDTVRGPDVMLFDDDDLESEVGRTWAEEPPLLAVEVVSPDDGFGSLMEQVIDQLRFGTPLVWVIDPEARNVIVSRPGKEPAVVSHEGDVTGEDVFPEFRCQVADFFRLPADRVTGVVPHAT